MSWLSGKREDSPLGVRAAAAQEAQRRATRSDRLCSGTLACRSCDAPVAVGPRPLLLGDPLTCPFCAHCGPAREFLSLAAPTRPAHVVVRISRPGHLIAPAPK